MRYFVIDIRQLALIGGDQRKKKRDPKCQIKNGLAKGVPRQTAGYEQQ